VLTAPWAHQGTLTQMRTPVSADRLEPFAESGACIARLTAHDQPGRREQAGDRSQAGN
jgi:hypothetical protein